MQRVRVGLTGLACVFLLVFLAAAFFGLAGPDAPDLSAQSPATPGPTTNSIAEPREPLAELGVTPGNVPGTTGPAAAPVGAADSAPSPAPAAPPAAVPPTAPPAR